MTGGCFNARARAAIYEVGHGRCIGCGSTAITAQHRRARGMGGTRDTLIGHPANGIPLCGSGTTGCHGWVEAHPTDGVLLGWRLPPGLPAIGAPFWDRVYGWRAWNTDLGLVFVDVTDLEDYADRRASVSRFVTFVAGRGDL